MDNDYFFFDIEENSLDYELDFEFDDHVDDEIDNELIVNEEIKLYKCVEFSFSNQKLWVQLIGWVGMG